MQAQGKLRRFEGSAGIPSAAHADSQGVYPLPQKPAYIKGSIHYALCIVCPGGIQLPIPYLGAV